MEAKRKIFNESCENFEFEKLKFYCRFTIRKTAENNYYHKRPLTEAQIEECLQQHVVQKFLFYVHKDEKN